ncbi:hypothetical protein BDV41DRAFT_526291 [Aspergillus transmontanensis]|uniref:Uncharacterized protein n=1 Tax=Aspergillus transmontanensis TaxID=1034304 RepID=A0A5N6W8T7_9EURO|nr:hypothetical protein BDV41DRAFT_526291 [Aspergillus transmontanensis]
MSDSPRILRIVAGWRWSNERGGMIAVINPSKLLVFKVLFNRPTTLGEELGVDLWAKDRATGLEWANEKY